VVNIVTIRFYGINNVTEQKCKPDVDGKNVKEKDQLEDLGVDGRKH
jgi:hypothetical protein